MPRSIRLRPATAADLEFLREVQRAAMRPHVERLFGVWDEEARRRRFYEKTDPSKHEVIEVDGEPVGCQFVRTHPGALELVRLYLLPAAQGRGVGTHLVRALLARARASGLCVRLRVFLGNPARRLYTRLGFVVTAVTDTHTYMEAPCP